MHVADIVGSVGRILCARRVRPTIVAFCGALTHALLWSDRGMRRVLRCARPLLARARRTGRADLVPHFDLFLIQRLAARRSRRGVYACMPILFDQKWSFPTDNEPTNALERLVRLTCPITERTKLLYVVSLCHPSVTLLVVVLLMLLVLCALLGLNRWCVRARMRRRETLVYAAKG